MNIKIKIVRIFPKDNNKATPLQKNKFEEIALFLDCPTIQIIIKNFRNRISLQKVIPYEKFDEWVRHEFILDVATKIWGEEESVLVRQAEEAAAKTLNKDELSREEEIFLSNLDDDIDYLLNIAETLGLSKEQRDELNQKEEERGKWLDPYYTFSRALEEELKFLKIDKFLKALIKAIVCGEVRNQDLSDELVERKGAKKAIFIQRQLFWQYELIQHKNSTKIGYGSIGKQVDKKLQSVRSNINSYKNKLKNYEATLISTT